MAIEGKLLQGSAWVIMAEFTFDKLAEWTLGIVQGREWFEDPSRPQGN